MHQNHNLQEVSSTLTITTKHKGQEMENPTYEAIVEEDEEGNIVIPFPEEMLKELGWLEDDELDITITDDKVGTITNLSWLERKSRFN